MFHATWWESPRLAEIDWMPLASDPLIAQSAQDAYAQAWSPFAEYAGDKLSDDMRAVGERFGKNIINTLNRYGEPPRTIVHGDYRLDNLFFGTPEGGAPLTVIDWQISTRGNGVFDVAYFICGSMEPADRRATEMDLLRMYHAVLVDGGVRAYDFDQCFEDYRASTLGCLLYSVLEIGSLDTANERGLELFTAIMERALSAVADLNADELLPQ
jgi:thiamine kinase-like enzyme